MGRGRGVGSSRHTRHSWHTWAPQVALAPDDRSVLRGSKQRDPSAAGVATKFSSELNLLLRSRESLPKQLGTDGLRERDATVTEAARASQVAQPAMPGHDLLPPDDGPSPRPYRGADRRGVLESATDPIGGAFIAAGFTLLIAVAAVGAIAGGRGFASLADSAALFVALETASVALALVAGVLCLVRWRLTADAAAFWMGSACALFGLVAVGLTVLLPQTDLVVFQTDVLGWVRPATLIVTLGLFARALRSPEVDAGLHPLTSLVGALGAVAALTVVLQLLPPLSAVVSGAADGVPEHSSGWMAPAVLTLLWGTAATLYMTRGIRLRLHLFAWFGLTMFGLTLSELTRALSVVEGGDWLTAAALLRASALAIAVAGATRGLQSLFADQSSRLHRTTLDANAHRARIEAERARAEERAHEARNALMAIEGASRTLDVYRQRLDNGTRDHLTRAISGEIARLQRLVDQQPAKSYGISFRLRDVVEAQLALAQTQGLQVLADLPDDLVAHGRPADVAEVLQNLLVNARRHAPSSAVTIRGRWEQDGVCVRVEDRGPGVPPSEREAIFGRGHRQTSSPGSGLGLYVSAQLMAAQGGDIWVEERVGGGASFVMRLPIGDSHRGSVSSTH